VKPYRWIGGLGLEESGMEGPGNIRDLLQVEITEADKVFDDSLPAYSRIKITDALGTVPGNDDPFTSEVARGALYFVNVGPDLYPDLTRGLKFGEYGIDKNILIHELAHVWQYYHGYRVVAGAAWQRVKEWAGAAAVGYAYTPGHPWDSYNVEQQARLVEDWYDAAKGDTKESDLRFIYIKKIIRPGLNRPSVFNKSIYDHIITHMSAAELRELDDG
jgi:hypothetical protein